MILNQEQAQKILPQKAPFVMVGELVDADRDRILTSFTINDDNVLCDDNVFTTVGLIENIAQTCALGFGYLTSLESKPNEVGFIGSISKLKVYSNPPVSSSITTKIEVLKIFENITLIEGASYYNGNKLLECRMKIVIV